MTEKNPEDTIEPLKDRPAEMSESLALFDMDAYRDDLAELDLTREEQTEILQALWQVMSSFVDIGWGVSNVQLLMPDLLGDVAPDSKNLIGSNDQENLEKGA